MTDAAGKQQLHEIDAVRGILMALGILLHAALPFAPGLSWLISDSDKSTLLGHVAEIIHLFRMPGFFIVAGFFSALGLTRSSRSRFLKKRSIRLLLPFCAALVMLNVPQSAFLRWWAETQCLGMAACAARITPGAWISHLWFLVYLMGYTILLAAGWSLVRPLLAYLHQRTASSNGVPTIALAVGMAGATGLALSAAARWYPAVYRSYLGFFNPGEFVFYLLFFVVGVTIYARGTSRNSLLFPSRQRTYALAGLAGALVGLQWLAREMFHGMAAKVLVTFSVAAWHAVLAFAAIWSLVYVFRHENPVTRRLSDSSYTVYLLHHVCIIFIAAWMTLFDLPPMFEYVWNVTVTLVICLIVHAWLVAPQRYLRLVFNGT